jgi:hypothetical protein
VEALIMARTRYYVGQYGYFWSFSRDEIKAFFEAAIANGGEYDLPRDKEVKRPKGIYVNGDGGGFWSSLTGANGRYYEPLDWDADAFQMALDAMNEEDAA